jgi:hypothetical protein
MKGAGMVILCKQQIMTGEEGRVSTASQALSIALMVVSEVGS